jgi:hypothetical protein
MDPTGEPRSSAAEPATPRDALPDETVVASLRARAPGLLTPRFDPRTVTTRARGALRRRRLRNSAMALAGAVATYLAFALVGPLPVPGVGNVSVPGSQALRALATKSFPFGPPGSDQRRADVDRLETEVLPVVEELDLSLYLRTSESCRILEYPRGNYRDGAPECQDLVPFDTQAREDFGTVTDAVERSGVAVERIVRDSVGTHVQLQDRSWRYNWEYAYLPGAASPPTTGHPSEQWTHIRGDWWLHRTHDD